MISSGMSRNVNLLTVLAVLMISTTVGLMSLENAYAAPNYFYAKSIQNYITPGGFMDTPTGIARDSAGNVYVVDNGNNEVQKFTGTGSFILQFGSNGNAQGQFDAPNGIAIDSSGNLYVVDTNNNRIEKFDSTGTFIRQFGNGVGGTTLNNPFGIFVNSTGYMFVTDSSNNVVKILDSSGGLVTQFNYSPGFNNPTGITVDSSGNIWVVDSGNGKVVKFDKNGNFISSFGSYGSGTEQLQNPRGISITSSGNILVADTDNNRIIEFSSIGTQLAIWAPAGSGNGQSNAPVGIVLDPTTGGFYFTDQQNHRIQKLDSTGLYLIQWGSYAVNQFLVPNGLRIDSTGNLYVADSQHNYVSKFDNTGNFVTGIGRGGTDNGEMQSPGDVAFDISGNLLVADSSNNRIQNLTPAGIYQSQFGSTGNAVNQFNNPTGITRDSAGNIYVVDNGNNRIVKYDSSGNNPAIFASTGLSFPSYAALNSTGYLFVTDTGNNQIKYYSNLGTLLGTIGFPGSGDGQFNSPQGIAIDSSGNILVADQGNNRIQVFDSHRNYLTQFGASGSGASQFDAPIGIALDNLGNVYVADSNNNRVEVFSTSLPSASLTINPVNPPSSRWGVDTVSVSGVVVNPAIGNTVSITWGDGSTSTATITITGTTGTWTSTHTYPSTAVGANNIVATLVNGATTIATSNTVSVSITAHHTAITLSLQTASSIPWAAPITVTGTLTDTDANSPVSSQLITLTGTGIGTLTNPTTTAGGTFTASGNAPVLVSPSLAINAQFAQNHAYLSSGVQSITYQTLKHNTSLLLNPISNILPGAPITVTGSLLDQDLTLQGIPSKTVTFTGTGIGTLTSTTTASDGTFTALGLAPLTVLSGLTVQAQFAGNANYTAASGTQEYSTLSQSILINPVSSTIIWSVPLTLSGTVQNPGTGDSVSITWGDGSTSTATITITGTTGTWTS
ncbi:MAG: hypothetical protein KGI28_05995, partial [Thaumarchaeota archaeon]|nr:hypothetical protein [Nitrososphaerota archaeon]